MKHVYYIKLSEWQSAVADIQLVEDRLWITQINVARDFRRQGHGSALLKMILEDADKEGVRLYLHPVSTGAMTGQQLRAWYARNGFVTDNETYDLIRYPQGGPSGRETNDHPSRPAHEQDAPGGTG